MPVSGNRWRLLNEVFEAVNLAGYCMLGRYVQRLISHSLALASNQYPRTLISV